MPWIMDIRLRELIVNLSPGVEGDAWDELLDHIIQELLNVDRVRLEVPADYEFGEQGQLLDTLVHVLTRRGVDVERRYLPS
jgi:hypothetical protein